MEAFLHSETGFLLDEIINRFMPFIYLYSRQRYAISRRAQNIINMKLNFAYAFILDCSQLSELIRFEILRQNYELTGPQAAFEYWCAGLIVDNLSKLVIV